MFYNIFCEILIYWKEASTAQIGSARNADNGKENRSWYIIQNQ